MSWTVIPTIIVIYAVIVWLAWSGIKDEGGLD
jgi:hypothetical protein